MVRILFVCLGNICRSPAAEGVFSALVRKNALEQKIFTDSAGTGDWHVNHPPDPRMINAAQARGVDLTMLRGRQVRTSDFKEFDYLLAMDTQNLEGLHRIASANVAHKAQLFLSYAPQATAHEVPDPYYGGLEGFDHVLDLIEDAAHGLLSHVRLTHKL